MAAQWAEHRVDGLKRAAWTTTLLMLLAAAAATFVALGAADQPALWIFAAVPFTYALYMVFPRARARRVAGWLKPFFPLLGELLAEENRRFAHRMVVEKMAETLAEFGLPRLDEEARRALADDQPAADRDEARVAHCARATAARFATDRPHLCPELLELLYVESHGAPDSAHWSTVRDGLAAPLARVLLDSRRLPRARDGLPLGAGELERLLRGLDVFTLDRVRNALDEVNVVWRRTSRYLAFLERHGIPAPERVERTARRAILRRLGRAAAYDPAAVQLAVLETAGRQAIALAHPGLDRRRVRTFVAVSLAVFLDDAPDLRQTICQRLAKSDAAVRVAFAYLELTEDLLVENRLGGKTFVSLDYLIENSDRKVMEKESELGAGFAKELAAIRDVLREGHWVTRVAPLLERTFRAIQKQCGELERLSEIIDERPSIRQSLERIFKHLRIETIERYLEARKINAYILTFNSAKGTLRQLLECLVDPEKKARMNQLDLGLKLEVDGRDKYNFQQYTASARIGVVPKGWTFERFYREFQTDFQKLVEARRRLIPTSEHDWNRLDLENIELIVNRFGLSGRNYYGFISEYTRPKAIEKIRELFAGLLDEEELVTLIRYESEIDLGAAIMEGSIVELVGRELDLEPEEWRFLERQDEVLRKAVFEALACRTPQELGRRLQAAKGSTREEWSRKAGGVLADLGAESLPELETERWRRIAEVYLETLAAAASLGR